LDVRLKKLVEKIKDESLRKKVADLLENPQIKIGENLYAGLRLESSPAGMSRHHSYPGGLIEHTVATAEIALTLCRVIRKIYKGKVNEDLVLAGALLHDVFKPLTYQVEEDGRYRITPLGERLDHLCLAVSELVRRGFPLDLVHIVCAHHGGEAGPVGPRTVEALICHLADVADSRLSGETLRAARYLIREVTGEELTGITSEEAFKIVNSKVAEGLEGVKKTLEKIRRKRTRVSQN